jgi:hypothetical protein
VPERLPSRSRIALGIRTLARLLAGAAAFLCLALAAPVVRGAETPSPAAGISATEHIFICCIYGPDRKGNFLLPAMLRRVGAQRNGNLWYYTNAIQRKVYVIHLVQTAEEMIQALYTEDAHIIVNGHSNSGMGCVFASSSEQSRQRITNIRYVDDDRFLICSSPWVAVNVPKAVAHQSYPNWWPVYKDGASAIAPYDFNDPRGDPAYNYYLTYQVPGDPTRHKIEPVPNSALERFPDSGRPAWYAADGRAPKAKNPDERKYFIVNTNTAFQSSGRWGVGFSPAGFYGSNYLAVAAGGGTNEARWSFVISAPGTYTVSARWPALADNVTNAQYTVAHAGGSTSVVANQRSNGGCWVALGSFKFDAGEYSVLLTDKIAAGAGNVIADAIQIADSTNAADVQVIDNEMCPKPHFGKKTLVACRPSVIDPAKMRYKRLFYEGCLSGNYFLEFFHRGITFYTVADSYLSCYETYLRNYLLGRSDEEIWGAIQQLEPVFDYYDFSLPPGRQRTKPVESAPAAAAPPLENDARLRRLARGSSSAVFDVLRQPEFVHDGPASRALVLAAFNERRTEAIENALAQLSLPLIERGDEARQSRIRSVIAARRIFEAFPEESVGPLLRLYDDSDAPTRGSIIRVAGKIPADGAIRPLLMGALGDERPSEGDNWNSGGAAMRVCDDAYNELVLRYQVQGVLHTVSHALPLEERRYHVARLKEKLAAESSAPPLR